MTLFERLVDYEIYGSVDFCDAKSRNVLARSLVRWKLTALTLAVTLVVLAIAGVWR